METFLKKKFPKFKNSVTFAENYFDFPKPMDKNLLLKKTKDLFFKYGIRSVTMDDIAAHLGVSKKTVYEHIKDKSDLIAQIAQMESAGISEGFKKIRNEGENAIEILLLIGKFELKIREMYPPTLEYDLQKYYPSVYKHIIKEQKKEMFYFLRENLERGIREEYYRKELDTQIIAAFHVAKMDLEIGEDFCTKSGISPQKIMHELLLYHLHAICSEKGRKYLKDKL